MPSSKNNIIYVKDVMLPLEKFPVLSEKIFFKEALEKMNKFRLGIACIVNNENKLLGILTDGDIRRKLLNVQKPFSAFFVDDVIVHSIQSPITIHYKETLQNSVKIMEQNQIWDLPVINDEGILVGLLHLHPAVKILLNNS
tara:strand:+ start:755 stop:1177 length:423 start_codon:yes stop_codon:yes gene_type:complete